MPLTDDTAPRMFIGYKEASGRPDTLDQGWQFAFWDPRAGRRARGL